MTVSQDLTTIPLHGNYFDGFGGCFVPEILLPALEQLKAAYAEALNDQEFLQELNELLKDFAGRPTPLYRCRNLLMV